MDLAASIQAVTEEVVLRLTRSLARQTGSRNLCLAGGVALNCVANGKILRDGPFENIWIQPAAGDAGGALGAALAAYHLCKGQPRKANRRATAWPAPISGPRFAQAEIEQRLTAAGARFAVLDEADDDRGDGGGAGRGEGRRLVPGAHGIRPARARRALDPRRSALAGDAEERSTCKVKYRESFRPFAPAVLRERRRASGSSSTADSPYMLLVADVGKTRVAGDDAPRSRRCSASTSSTLRARTSRR